MKIAMYVLGALGAVVFLLVLIVSSLPSPTVRQLLERLQNRSKK